MKQRRRDLSGATLAAKRAERESRRERKQENLHPDTSPRHADTFRQAAQLRDLGMTQQETQTAWSDQPAADYPESVLEWVFTKMGDPRVDAYHCKGCDQVVVTVDKHPGATPMFVSHGMFGVECDGETASAWYRVRQEFAVYATHEWYRPSADELLDQHALAARSHFATAAEQRSTYIARGAIEHVLRGGLLLRPIPDDSDTIVQALARATGVTVQGWRPTGTHARRTGKTAAGEAAMAAEVRLQQPPRMPTRPTNPTGDDRHA